MIKKLIEDIKNGKTTTLQSAVAIESPVQENFMQLSFNKNSFKNTTNKSLGFGQSTLVSMSAHLNNAPYGVFKSQEAIDRLKRMMNEK